MVTRLMVIQMMVRALADGWIRVFYGLGLVERYARLVAISGVLQPIIIVAAAGILGPVFVMPAVVLVVVTSFTQLLFILRLGPSRIFGRHPHFAAMAPRGDAGCVPAAAAPVGTAKCRLAGLVWGVVISPYLWRAFPKVQQDSRAFGFVKVLTAPVHASILSDVNPLPPLGSFSYPNASRASPANS